MSETMVFTVGLPFGSWSDAVAVYSGDDALVGSWIESLHREVFSLESCNCLPVARLQAFLHTPPDPEALRAWDASSKALPGVRKGGADERLCWTGDALARAWPEARFVVMVEHPALALANWVRAGGGEGKFAEAFALVESAVLSAAQLIQQHGAQCVVVDLADAISQPDAVMKHLGEWLNSPPPEVKSTANLAPADSLLLALAARWAATSGRLQRAFERLYASCILVGNTTPASSVAIDSPHVIVEAVRSYFELVQRSERVEMLQRTLVQVESERHDLANKADQDRVVLTGQLQGVLQELEVLTRRYQQADDLALSAQQQAREAEARVGQLQQLNANLAAERDRLNQEAGRLAEQKSMQASQGEVLLTQLHQVQEELTRQYTARQELEAASALSHRGRAAVHVSRVLVGRAHEDAPYRELNLTLHGVKAPDRARKLVDVKLVEHHGRPGVLFFEHDSSEQCLLAWEPTGKEGNRSFMLMVPGDEQSRVKLSLLGASDWRFVQGVALFLALYLRDLKTQEAARWSVVANKMVKALADLPARFRFDAIDVQADSSEPEAMRVSFLRVVFGDRELPKLLLLWRPYDRPGAVVEILIPECRDDASVFGAWPVDERGTWKERWRLPLGDVSRSDGERMWRAFSRDDREGLLGMLDAMRAAAKRAVELGLADASGRRPLDAVAVGSLRQAHHMLHGNRLRRVFLALRGRVNL